MDHSLWSKLPARESFWKTFQLVHTNNKQVLLQHDVYVPIHTAMNWEPERLKLISAIRSLGMIYDRKFIALSLYDEGDHVVHLVLIYSTFKAPPFPLVHTNGI